MSIQDDNATNLDDHNQLPWEIKNDLATVSCLAAGEVDKLIIGCKVSFDAVKRLVEMIEHSITFVEKKKMPKSMIDSATAVVMNRAMEDYDPALNHSPNTVDQLIKQTEEITRVLKMLMNNPQDFHLTKPEDLKRLRNFCQSVARNAIAYEESVEELGMHSF